MKISIIVPVYNTEKYLNKCLDSIIEQSYNNIEIICVNDGSTDNSLEILKEYRNKDDRVIIINQQNQGLVKVRMNALKKCTGGYVMFVDSDDWIENNTVEKLVKIIQTHKSIDIIKFKFVMEPKGNVQPNYFNNTNLCGEKKLKLIYKELFTSSKYNNLANQIIKKELFHCVEYDNFKKINQGEDKYINIDLFLNAKEILFINDVLYHYNYNPNSISHNIDKDKYIQKFTSLCLLYNKINKNVKKIFPNDLTFEKKVKMNQIEIFTNYLEKFLSLKNIEKKDLDKIQSILIENNFYNNIKNIKINKLHRNIVYNRIAKNILNKKIEYCYTYKLLFSLKRFLKG